MTVAVPTPPPVQPPVPTPSEQVTALAEALNSGTMQTVRKMLRALHPAEVAQLLESLPRAQRFIVWGMLDHEHDGEVLLEVGDEVRVSLIGEMDEDALVSATEGLDIDDLADLLADLPEAVSSQILNDMDQQYRSRLEAVLTYDEDTAGGLMDTSVITVRADVTLEVVLRYLRRHESIPSHTDVLMVVDRFEHYRGVLPITALLLHDPDTLVGEVMESDRPPIPAEMPDGAVAAVFEDRDLVSAAVVDENNLLLGRITVDDVVDVIRDEGVETLHSYVGLSEDEDLFDSVLSASRRRAVWLGVNLVTAFIAAAAIGLFQDTLERVVALAVLMPIVASMGGIAGSQTLILVIRGMALGQVSSQNVRALLLKELGVGLVNSLVWCGVVALVAGLWFDTWMIGAVIALALIANMVFAALTGVLLPPTLRRLNIDPALAGGVLLTTVTDVVGFVAFLGLGTALLL